MNRARTKNTAPVLLLIFFLNSIPLVHGNNAKKVTIQQTRPIADSNATALGIGTSKASPTDKSKPSKIIEKGTVTSGSPPIQDPSKKTKGGLSVVNIKESEKEDKAQRMQNILIAEKEKRNLGKKSQKNVQMTASKSMEQAMRGFKAMSSKRSK